MSVSSLVVVSSSISYLCETEAYIILWYERILTEHEHFQQHQTSPQLGVNEKQTSPSSTSLAPRKHANVRNAQVFGSVLRLQFDASHLQHELAVWCPEVVDGVQ